MVIDDEERYLFRKAVRNVTPLEPLKRALLVPKPHPRPRRHGPGTRETPGENPDDFRDSGPRSAESPLFYAAPGIQRRVLRRLRRGQFAVQAVLDLHGSTREQAHRELAGFIAKSQNKGFTCVRIIHGKGYGSGPEGPVLKQAVACWLGRSPEVLAYASARPVDGGTGAVYVLFSKHKSS